MKPYRIVAVLPTPDRYRTTVVDVQGAQYEITIWPTQRVRGMGADAVRQLWHSEVRRPGATSVVWDGEVAKTVSIRAILEAAELVTPRHRNEPTAPVELQQTVTTRATLDRLAHACQCAGRTT